MRALLKRRLGRGAAAEGSAAAATARRPTAERLGLNDGRRSRQFPDGPAPEPVSRPVSGPVSGPVPDAEA